MQILPGLLRSPFATQGRSYSDRAGPQACVFGMMNRKPNRNLSVNLDHLLECIKTLELEEYVLRIGDNVSIGA
ncbi:hypothetical protein D3C76_1335940 [compost metagenome]